MPGRASRRLKRGPDKAPRQFWSQADLRRLAELYPHRPTKDVAELLGRTLISTYGAAQKHGLKKSQEFLATDPSCRLRKGHTKGRGTQFPKGHVPANKGLRRPGYFAGRMKQTQFRKGCRSGKAAQNWRPIGTILKDPEGYLRIKVREAVYGKEPYGFGNSDVWPQLHRQIWLKERGPIPPGHVVVFKDRNREHCVIENLELISRGELARRNAMWNRFPPELTHAIMLNGALKRKLRSGHGKEQN